MPKGSAKSLVLWVRLSLILFLLTLVGLLLSVIVLFPPTKFSIYPKCQFHAVTGWHCPGCGLTRCAYALTQGDLSQAFAWHPLGVILLPLLGWFLLSFVWKCFRRDQTQRKISMSPATSHQAKSIDWLKFLGLGFIAWMILFGILRNLPYEPFTWLAPHELQR